MLFFVKQCYLRNPCCYWNQCWYMWEGGALFTVSFTYIEAIQPSVMHSVYHAISSRQCDVYHLTADFLAHMLLFKNIILFWFWSSCEILRIHIYNIIYVYTLYDSIHWKCHSMCIYAYMTRFDKKDLNVKIHLSAPFHTYINRPTVHTATS